MRVVLCGADDDALAWSRRAALRAGVEVVALLDARAERGLAERAALLRDLAPDALLAVGGGRARLLVDVVEAARAAFSGNPAPHLVVAGEAALQAELQHAAAGALPILRAAPPSRDGGASVLGELRALRRRDAPLALEELESRTRALAVRGAVACELEGAATRLAVTVDDEVVGVELPTLGVAEGADALARRVGAEALRRWLPFAIDEAALLDRAANLARWPAFRPTDPAALALRLALAREALRLAADAVRASLRAPSLALPRAVVLWAELARGLPPSGAVAAVLDGLQPRGAFRVLAEGDPLGLVIAEPAARDPLVLRIEDEAGARERRAWPWQVALFGATGATKVRLARPKLALEGQAGRLGVLVDARPRPLVLPERDAERLPLVSSWAQALGLG